MAEGLIRLIACVAKPSCSSGWNFLERQEVVEQLLQILCLAVMGDAATESDVSDVESVRSLFIWSGLDASVRAAFGAAGKEIPATNMLAIIGKFLC